MNNNQPDDKLPPHSEDAEEGILGCILLAPNTAIPKCIGLLKPGGSAFYNHKLRAIYEMALTLWNGNGAVDIITIRNAIPEVDIAYLSSLPDKVPSAENLEFYVDIVIEKYALRKAIIESVTVINKAQEEKHNAQTIIAGAAAALESISQQTTKESQVSTPKSLVPEALGQLEHLLVNAGNVTGLPSGLVDLDHMTWGFQPGEFCVIAARPSIGKTALACAIAEYAALEKNLPVAFFSIEMTSHTLMLRMLCSRARISVRDVREGTFTPQDQEKLMAASSEYLNAPIYIDDASQLSVLEMRAKAKRMIAQYGIKVFLIDYLQLMSAKTGKGENRQQEVSYISQAIKALAKDTKLPVIALAQLNRKLDDRGSKARPKLSDLRESGSIEQDVDVAILLSKDKEDEEEDKYKDTITVRADVAKNRNGPTGEVDLILRKSCTRFENKAPEPFEPPPLIVLEQQPKDTLL